MSVFTSTQLTTDCSPRTATANIAVLHHAALTGSVDVLVGMMMSGGRTVSAHAAIKDDQIVHTVPLDKRAWSLGDAYWDSRAFTCECVNDSANGWTLSIETHESIAQFVAAMANEFGFRPHRSGDPRSWTVLGHREVYTIHGGSYATACPGGMDLAWITKRAQQILDGGDGPAAIGGGGAASTWAGYSIREIQERLTAHGFKTAVDGIYGPDTTRQVRRFQKKAGLTADGDVGPVTWSALQEDPAKASKPSKPKPTENAPSFPLPRGYYFGPREGPRRSVSGYYSWRHELRRWQQRMIDRGWIFHHGADGLYGPETRENTLAFQREKGLKVDGLIGPVTWRAAWEEPVT